MIHMNIIQWFFAINGMRLPFEQYSSSVYHSRKYCLIDRDSLFSDYPPVSSNVAVGNPQPKSEVSIGKSRFFNSVFSSTSCLMTPAGMVIHFPMVLLWFWYGFPMIFLWVLDSPKILGRRFPIWKPFIHHDQKPRIHRDRFFGSQEDFLRPEIICLR